MNMEYLFGENRFVYDKPKDAPSAASSSSAEAPKSSPVEAKEEAKEAILDANKQARKKLDPLNSLSEEDAKKAFSFMEKEKFEEKTVEEMLALSENMSVYDLWRGGIARMKNEKDLKDNQGFDRMAAQFVKKEVDERGSTYLAVNLQGKDKYEMNIGAGHICPPSWKKVAIVDTSGNTRVGERKVPRIDDDVRGHKVGYYDENGEYLAIFSGYKIYPLEISSENESVEKESKFYSENKDKLNDYVVEAGSYSVKQAEMSPAEIQRIRDLIPGLEDKDPGERVAAVADWVTKNEIYAKHCWNWVERVYAIAGVTGKQRLYWNLDYAKGPDGKLVKGRDGGNIDATKGKHALNDKPHLLENLKPGAHLCINNRNTSDDYGNHSVIFIKWVNKPNVALCANWMNPSKGFQKITRYDFNEKPVVAIFEPTVVEKKFTRLSPEEMAREKTSEFGAGNSTRTAIKHLDVASENFTGTVESGEFVRSLSLVETQDGQKYYHIVTRATIEPGNGIRKMNGRWDERLALDWAKDLSVRYGVPQLMILGTAILESGRGHNRLSYELGNYFGIKPWSKLKEQMNVLARSKYSGYRELGDFSNNGKQDHMHYTDAWSSFVRYSQLISKAERYRHALKYKDNPMMALACIALSGYCPSETYISSVGKVYRHLSKKYGFPLGRINYPELLDHMKKNNHGKLTEEQIRARVESAARDGFVDGFR